jgi:hypothetical protein
MAAIVALGLIPALLLLRQSKANAATISPLPTNPQTVLTTAQAD